MYTLMVDSFGLIFLLRLWPSSYLVLAKSSIYITLCNMSGLSCRMNQFTGPIVYVWGNPATCEG